MSRRILVLVLLVTSVTACTNSVTAPARPTLAPTSAAQEMAADLTTCRGGWTSSAGRC